MASESLSDTAVAGKAVRLRGWKEIGRWFGVDERTVKRWEASRGLPVHRVPGEPRAPVFAYENELKAWVARDRAGDGVASAEPVPEPPPAPERPWLTVALLLLALAAGMALWMGKRAADTARMADASVAELKRLAGAQVAALNDQLDSQPGTVGARAALAKDAVQVLGRVAALPDASAALKQEAAEGYRRLAVLQNAIDRPSLRDRGAARQSLDQAIALLQGDRSTAAAEVRARVQIEAARQAAGDGDLLAAEELLAQSRPVALSGGSGALTGDWWLAESAILGWKGDYARSAAAARNVKQVAPADALQALQQTRALDFEAEALYYLQDVEAALAIYQQAVSSAGDGLKRWPDDGRLRWALLRQKWNLGSTLIQMQQPEAAVPVLAGALDGWRAMARADPSDEAVRVWVWVTRLSYGQALSGSRDYARAVPVLSEAVAERRQWLGARPDEADRRRMLMKAQAALADTLAAVGRRGEACALYAEAGGLAGEMERAGQLTGHDRGETLRLLGDARHRYCP
jgi:tetratricopeptide (TPR) repeat protein